MSREPPKVTLLNTAYRPDQLRKISGPVVLFLGRSNAGKSSLLNAVIRKELANISKTPGKTRSINYYQYGSKITLVDLPGYGYARRGKNEKQEWTSLIRAFFDSLNPKSLAFLLMDSRRDLEKEEWNLIEALLEDSHQVEILLTKSDQFKQSEKTQKQRNLEQQLKKHGLEKVLAWHYVSVKNLRTVETIRREIYQYGQNFSH